jgi:FMN-dependent NADH-azoreductase
MARVMIITARGGAYGPGTPRAACDCQEPYLRTELDLVGLTDIIFLQAEMRATAEGNPELASFTPFAADSLLAAQQAVIVEATQPHSRQSPAAHGALAEALEAMQS